LLYTRFRSDPDPWQGSPPKTPPSSDDENDENMQHSNSNSSSSSNLHYSHQQHHQHHRLRTHIQRAAFHNLGSNMNIKNKPMETPNSTKTNSSGNTKTSSHRNSNSNSNKAVKNKSDRGNNVKSDVSSDEYGMNSNPSNISISSGFTRSSCETVAPAPIIINTRSEMGNQGCRRRLNEVKRKISKYVKMENAHVLQSAQFTHKQTKLNVKKTAPVPLPFAIANDEVMDSKKLKIKAITSKQKQSKQQKQQKSKHKQKQTAPVPLPAHLINPSKSTLKTKTKQKGASSAVPPNLHTQAQPIQTQNAYKVRSSKAKSNCKPAGNDKRKAPEFEVAMTAPVITDSAPNAEFPSDYQTEYSLPTNHSHSSSVQNLADTYFDISTPKNLANKNMSDLRGADDDDDDHKISGGEQGDDDELIDFALIPEAYYIGFDSNMEALTQHSHDEHEAFLHVPMELTVGPSMSTKGLQPHAQQQQQEEEEEQDKHVLDLDIAVIQKDINAMVSETKAEHERNPPVDEESHGTPNSNNSNNNSSSNDIVIYSPISAQNSLNAAGTDISYYSNQLLSDFTNSNSSLLTSTTPKFKTSPQQLIEMEFDDKESHKITIQSVQEHNAFYEKPQNAGTFQMSESEAVSVSVREMNANSNQEDVYFDDQKFTMLAEQILEEKTPSPYAHGNNQYAAALQYNHSNRVSANPYTQAYDANISNSNSMSEVACYPASTLYNSGASPFVQPSYSFAYSHQPVQQRHNIWSEPWKCQYTYNYPEQSTTTTLGGLLMHGLPPIQKELFH